MSSETDKLSADATLDMLESDTMCLDACTWMHAHHSKAEAAVHTDGGALAS